MRVQRVIWQGVYNYTAIAKTRAKRLTRACRAWHKKSRSACLTTCPAVYRRVNPAGPLRFSPAIIQILRGGVSLPVLRLTLRLAAEAVLRRATF